MGAARYPEEFKRDAVELVRSTGQTVGSVAKELGVNPESLRHSALGHISPIEFEQRSINSGSLNLVA